MAGVDFSIDVPGTVLLAGYGLGLLIPGVNSIPADVIVTIEGSNTAEGSQELDPVSVLGVTTITDPTPWLPGPDGIVQSNPNSTTKAVGSDDVLGRTSGDETAAPLAVSATLPTTTWDPTGGDVEFSLGGSSTTALVGPGGIIAVNFSCVPGTPGPAGCGDPPAADCTTTIPAEAEPFDTVTVVAPPTAPACSNESTSVGITQTIPIDLTDNCSDVNGNIDATTFSLSNPSVGVLTETGDGTYTYEAPAADPGTPVVMNFTVADAGGLVSNTGTVSITILANSCDATSAACSLTEIVVQPVVGTTMTLDKVAGIVQMSPVVLNGEPQASTGSLQDLTVTNARGTATGWTLSGFVSDLGAPGSPTLVLPTGQEVSVCSAAGSLGAVTAQHRLCIPGDNMGWTPSASVAHDVIFGDVAEVDPGDSDAIDADDWLSQLITAGTAGVDGIGGLTEVNELCSAPLDHSGGTFACDAALYLGVPASAGKGTYAGGIVLTLL